MEKLTISGFGNEGHLYYLTLKKQEKFFVWLQALINRIKTLSSSKHSIGFNAHDSDMNMKVEELIDQHEFYSLDNARVDIFYGKDIVFITVVSDRITKKELLDKVQEIADLP